MSYHTADFCFSTDCEINIKSSDETPKLKKFTGGKNYPVDCIREHSDGTIDIFFTGGVVIESVNRSELGAFLGNPAKKDDSELAPTEPIAEEADSPESEEQEKNKWF